MPEYPILLTLQQAAKRSGKSEKTLRRWIKEGKLLTYHAQERQPGDPYMIYPKDLDAATGGDKTKEWQLEQQIADVRMKVVMLESVVDELQYQARDQERDIDERHDPGAEATAQETAGAEKKAEHHQAQKKPV